MVIAATCIYMTALWYGQVLANPMFSFQPLSTFPSFTGHLFAQQPQATAVVKSAGDAPAILAQLPTPASQLDALSAMASAVCKFSL